jgi:hypothetical protein
VQDVVDANLIAQTDAADHELYNFATCHSSDELGHLVPASAPIQIGMFSRTEIFIWHGRTHARCAVN